MEVPRYWRLKETLYSMKPGENGSFPPRPIPLNANPDEFKQAFQQVKFKTQVSLDEAYQRMYRETETIVVYQAKSEDIDETKYPILIQQPAKIIVYDSKQNQFHKDGYFFNFSLPTEVSTSSK